MPWLFLIILFVNVISPKSSFETAKENGDHQLLGEQLLKFNQLNEAAKEFRLSGNDKGLEQIFFLDAQPQQLINQVSYYQRVLESFPDYRDVYIKIAILNNKLYFDDGMDFYINKGLALDPNNEVLLKLKLQALLPQAFVLEPAR